jgi:hypothetical protein
MGVFVIYDGDQITYIEGMEGMHEKYAVYCWSDLRQSPATRAVHPVGCWENLAVLQALCRLIYIYIHNSK